MVFENFTVRARREKEGDDDLGWGGGGRRGRGEDEEDDGFGGGGRRGREPLPDLVREIGITGRRGSGNYNINIKY